MKRFLSAAVVLCLCTITASAYNPPVNGENLYELASPHQLASSSSVTGGAILYDGVDSVIANPAISAEEQRISLTASYTSLFNKDKEDSVKYGSALEAGILIPFKFAVFTGLFDFVSAEFQNMDLGNSINGKFVLAKEMTDKLNIGIGLNTGFFWKKSYGTDWGLSANIGYTYNFGQVGFLKDFKYGVSILNLGKNFGEFVMPHVLKDDEPNTAFPTLATVKLGTSALLLSNDAVKFGFCLDVTTPMFLNVIFDAGLAFAIKDCVFITVSEKFNLLETINHRNDFIPSIGISCRFSFDFKSIDYMQKNGWEQSEVSGSVIYKPLYNSINLISAGLDINLGMEDKTPPVIELWPEEGDEE